MALVGADLDHALLTHPNGHHQLITGFLVLQQVFHNIVLVVLDGLAIAGAEGGQEFHKFLVLVLDLAQVDELLDDPRGDLSLQQLLVVTQQLLHRALRIYVILFVSFHSLREEEVDPLGGVHLIDFVATDGALQENVGVLA